MKKGLLIALAVVFCLVLLGVAAEFVMTRQAEAYVGRMLKDRLKLKAEPDVTIVAHPLVLKVVLGEIDYIQIDARNVPYERSRADEVLVRVKNLEFDPGAVRRGEFVVETADLAMVQIVVSQTEVNKYLANSMPPGSEVKLGRGRLRYSSRVTYFGQTYDLNVTGTIRIDPTTNNLSFFPDRSSLEALPVPEAVKDYLAATLSTQVPLTDIPVEAKLVRVEIEPGRLVIEGQLTDLEIISGGSLK